VTFCILANNSASDPSQNSCKPLGKLSRENGLEMMATLRIIEISLAHGGRPFYRAAKQTMAQHLPKEII